MAEPYRPYKKVYTYQEVCEMCRNTDLSKITQGSLISHYRPPFSDYFINKSYDFHFNSGKNMHYHFITSHKLEWSSDGRNFAEEEYEALESPVKGVFLIQHIRRRTIPIEGVTLIIDTEKELVTCVELNFGTEDCDKNVRCDYLFGYYGSKKEQLHGFTTDLCGYILDWKYTDDFIIRHSYITPYSMTSPGEPSDDENDYLFRKTLPAQYAKIRDNLCTVTFVEDGGSSVTLLIDMQKLRDVGAFFGLGDNGQLWNYTVGAVAGKGTFGFTGKYSIDYGPEPE